MTERPWQALSPDERRAARIDRWRNPGAGFASPEAETEYRRRVDRIIAALELREPDRVPVCLIDEGMIPLCFAEGRFGARLGMIMDLPKGKTVWAFDQIAGTREEVAAYTP